MTKNVDSGIQPTRDYLADQMALVTAVPGVHLFDLRQFMTEYFGLDNGKIRATFEFDAGVFLPKDANYADFIVGNWGDAILLGAALTLPQPHQLHAFYDAAANEWLNTLKKDIAYKWTGRLVILYIDGAPVSAPSVSIEEAKISAFVATMNQHNIAP